MTNSKRYSGTHEEAIGWGRGNKKTTASGCSANSSKFRSRGRGVAEMVPVLAVSRALLHGSGNSQHRWSKALETASTGSQGGGPSAMDNQG